MGIAVGPGTNHCSYRSSVVGDASDVAPDTEVVGTGTVGRNTPAALQRKAFVGVGVRSQRGGGLGAPRHPREADLAAAARPRRHGRGRDDLALGQGEFVKAIGKPNTLLLRTFDFGTTDTQLIATINNKSVVTLTDSADDQPDGRRNVVVAGAKGTAAGTGIAGLFDDVAIRVPNPYE